MYNILNLTCKGYRINQYQKYYYFRIFIIISLGRMNITVHRSKGNYNKDADIKKNNSK